MEENLFDDERNATWERPPKLVAIDDLTKELAAKIQSGEAVCPFATMTKVSHLVKDLVSLGTKDYMLRLLTIVALVPYLFKEGNLEIEDYLGKADPRWQDAMVLVHTIMAIEEQTAQIREAANMGCTAIAELAIQHGHQSPADIRRYDA